MGRVVKTPSPFGFYSFLPAPIPRSLLLHEQTVMELSEADAALGRLAGAGRLLPNPYLLARPYATREAVASSRIEGTQASLSEVFQAQAVGASPNHDAQRQIETHGWLTKIGLSVVEIVNIGSPRRSSRFSKVWDKRRSDHRRSRSR